MRSRRRQLAAALAAAALIAVLLLSASDGGPDLGGRDELSQKDSRALTNARRSLDAAMETVATLSDPQSAGRVSRKVQAIVSEGAFETGELDEFGLAALGRLGLIAPSLVVVDEDGVPEALDVEATREFLRFAERDPARALLGPAEELVGAIERTLKRSEAGPATRILPAGSTLSVDLTVEDYLQGIEVDTEAIWPDLAGRLRVLREGL